MSLLKYKLWKHINICSFIEQKNYVSRERTLTFAISSRTELQIEKMENITRKQDSYIISLTSSVTMALVL